MRRIFLEEKISGCEYLRGNVILEGFDRSNIGNCFLMVLQNFFFTIYFMDV